MSNVLSSRLKIFALILDFHRCVEIDAFQILSAIERRAEMSPELQIADGTLHFLYESKIREVSLRTIPFISIVFSF